MTVGMILGAFEGHSWDRFLVRDMFGTGPFFQDMVNKVILYRVRGSLNLGHVVSSSFVVLGSCQARFLVFWELVGFDFW